MRKHVFGVSDQVRKKLGCKTRGLKFRSLEVEELYYLCSENEGADQLGGYHAANLWLCFRICEKAGFLMTQLILF